MKLLLKSLVLVVIAGVALTEGVYALLEESVKVAGTAFTVSTTPVDGGGGGTPTGNTSLKLLANAAGTSDGSNLVDSVNGPTFDNIKTSWKDQKPVKLYNKGTAVMSLVASADYISDPDVLRDDLYVEIVGWNDTDNDGVVDTGEEGTSYGKDTILRLRNDTFVLGTIDPSEKRGFIFKFDGTGLTESNASQTATYDFVIKGITQ